MLDGESAVGKDKARKRAGGIGVCMCVLKRTRHSGLVFPVKDTPKQRP